MSLMRGGEVEVEVKLVLSSSEVEEDEEQEEEEEEERSQTVPFWDLLPFSGNHGSPKGSDSVKFELNNAGTVANPSGVTDIWREERERESWWKGYTQFSLPLYWVKLVSMVTAFLDQCSKESESESKRETSCEL